MGAKGKEILDGIARRMRRELEADILPWWLPRADAAGGGFQGMVLPDGKVVPGSPKGLVMHSRFLWAYSAAFRRYGDPRWLDAARRAYDFLAGPLRDREHGGFWWVVDAGGEPMDRDKMVYGQAFALYGLSEFYRATKRADALALAGETFDLLEARARDRRHGGYCDTIREDWSEPFVKALSEVDIPAMKTMNANLHVLEALSAFRLATGRADAMGALQAQVETFVGRVFAGSPSLSLYFDADWKSLREVVSYGHDVEACWLVTEAADIAYGRGDGRGGSWPAAIREAVLRASAASLAAVQEDGVSMPNEKHGGEVDRTRIWWVQAEAVVGLANGFRLTGNDEYAAAAAKVWDFIDSRLIDRVHGEWHWSVDDAGRPDPAREKGGLWKTCYHNGRACLELMSRAGI